MCLVVAEVAFPVGNLRPEGNIPSGDSTLVANPLPTGDLSPTSSSSVSETQKVSLSDRLLSQIVIIEIYYFGVPI